MKRPWISGFCGADLPPDSHQRCNDHPRADGKPCACTCHEETTVTITETAGPQAGFHDDIPEPEYHAHVGSLSVTGAKTILKAPALFKYQREHPVHKDVFDLGSGAHRRVLGVGPDIVVVQREMRDRKGELLEVVDAPDYKSTSAQEHRDEIRASGRIPLLRSEFDQVQAMADALSEHSLAMQLLSEGKPEVSAFCLDEETGVMRRGRFDYLGPSIITDYKSAISADPGAFGRAAANFGYHMQAAWYADLAADLGHPAKGFVFIVQEKAAPYLVTVVELTPDAVQRGRELNRLALQRFRDCTASGVWPGYTRGDQIVPVDIPRWAYTDNEENIA